MDYEKQLDASTGGFRHKIIIVLLVIFLISMPVIILGMYLFGWTMGFGA